jgi:predicted acetyltransferase
MNNLYLEIPTIESKHDVWLFRETFTAPAYVKNIPGSSDLDSAQSYEKWLEKEQAIRNDQTLLPGMVKASTFLVRRVEDAEMVGIVNIRHTLNDLLLQVGGHVGYSIGPQYRGKGYGKELLLLALDFCRSIKLDRVLVTCDVRNKASAQVIVVNGGKLENEIIHEGTIKQRYWIQL